jgi:arabinose-5-phosphate isomerase
MRHDDLPLTDENAKFTDVIKLITDYKLGMAMVLSNDTLTGVLTDGDIRRTLLKYNNISNLSVKEVMTANPKRILGSDYGASALNLMEKHSITVLPVVDATNKPVGVIHIHDLLKAGVA